MKHLKQIFTALLLLCSATAFAEYVIIDNITYNIIEKGKVAKVVDGKIENSGNIVIPEEFIHGDIVYSVTSISRQVFYDRYGDSSLTSVTIPKTVKSIGYGAFGFCYGLTAVHISDLASWCNIDFEYEEVCGYSSNPLVYAGKLYLNGVLVTELTIPDSVTRIKSAAFAGCSCLTSVTIPNSVTSIENSAFGGCSGLTNATIPNSVTSIGSETFYKCIRLTSVTIPNSVTSIGSEAFSGCRGLTDIVVENGNPKYDSRNNCNAIIETLTNTLITGCKNTAIPNSVTSIGDYAFYDCDSLKSIIIPNSVTSIGSEAFYGCKGLTSVTIGNSVTSIKSSAFYNCSGLTSVEIPNSVTSIGVNAFGGCSGLTSVTIGSAVGTIGSNAFAYCKDLTDVYCHATTVPSTGGNAFNESYPEYMTLHVPAEAINKYKTTAPWSSFGTIVALEGGGGSDDDIKKCATPSVAYSNGNLTFSCDTEGAEFITEIKSNDIGKFFSNSIELSATYNISFYATAQGYENSETVNATLCWVDNNNGNNNNNVIDVQATPILVTSTNGTVTVSSSLDGEVVSVYTLSGTLVGTNTIENGVATITTGLTKGTAVVINIRESSIKVVVQ